jgi:hypothetical protein
MLKQVGTLILDSKAQSKARRARLEQTKIDKQAKQQLEAEQKMKTTGKIFTLEELRKFDGTDEALPILFSIRGHVLDVTTSKQFYGAGAPRGMYAGTGMYITQ